MAYKVFVSTETLAKLPKSGRRRDAIFKFLENLGEDHRQKGNLEVICPDTGRDQWVSLIEGYAITWWVDSPVREVKIAAITIGISQSR